MAGFTEFETSDRVLNTRMNTFGNELYSEITKYSTYDLYLKQGNLMNPQKPTGVGTEVLFANVTDVEKLAYTFNYAIPEDLIISKDNRYNLVIPFKQLDPNRSFIFRFLYKHEGTTIFDITRNAVTTATGDLMVEFQALNQNIVDITAPANTTVTLQIFVKTTSGTDAQISLLVNDVNALGRLSRNEATAIISADNVLMSDGVTSVNSAIGQLSNPNLLINGDFQIWQRGTIFETGEGTVLGTRPYTADRWRIGSDSGKIRVTKENGIKATFLSNGNFIINQPTAIKELDLRGKKFTLSTKISSSKALTLNIYVSTDGINYMNLATTPILQNSIIKLTATLPINVVKFVVEINGDGFITNDTVNIEYIKLELGEIATPLSPRPYGEELALCKRYYQKINYNDKETIGTVNASNTWLNLMISTGTELRSTPTVDITCSPTRSDNNTVFPPFTNISTRGGTANLGFTYTGTPTNCYSYANQQGYISLDAEIY